MLFKTQGYILYRPTCRVCPSSPSEVSCAPCALCRPSVLHHQGEMHRDQPRLHRESARKGKAAGAFSWAHRLIIIGIFIQVFVEALSLRRSQSWCRGNGDVIHPNIGLEEIKLQMKAVYLILLLSSLHIVYCKNIFRSRVKPGLVHHANHTGISAQGVNAEHHLFLSWINSICCVCVVPRFHILPHARFGASCPWSQTNYWRSGGGGGAGEAGEGLKVSQQTLRVQESSRRGF